MNEPGDITAHGRSRCVGVGTGVRRDVCRALLCRDQWQPSEALRLQRDLSPHWPFGLDLKAGTPPLSACASGRQLQE